MASERRNSKRSRSDGNGSPRVRYAVVGLGWIAQSAVLPAFAQARKNSELFALVSDDETKLKTLGRKYQVEERYTYDEFSRCLEDPDLDAVFIALPNSMHRAYTEAAARAGKVKVCGHNFLARDCAGRQKI